MEGALTFSRLALRPVVFVGSLSMLLFYFSTDVHAYGKPSHFGWTVSIAVVVPVVAVLLVHWCCQLNGPISCSLDPNSTGCSPKPPVVEHADDMELGMPPSEVSDHGYRLVPTGGDPTAS